jgi:hypothetical protein
MNYSKDPRHGKKDSAPANDVDTIMERTWTLNVVAHNLGHATTHMTEKHYAHLAPSYIAETIRRLTPTFLAPDETNIVPLGRGQK